MAESFGEFDLTKPGDRFAHQMARQDRPEKTIEVYVQRDFTILIKCQGFGLQLQPNDAEVVGKAILRGVEVSRQKRAERGPR